MDDSRSETVNRRAILAGGATAALAVAAAEAAPKPVKAPAKKPPVVAPRKPATTPTPKPPTPPAPTGPPINVAVIGLGAQGREHLASLSRVGGANVVAVCDTYEAFLRRAKESAPKAEGVTEYRRILERSDIQAVFVATPTYLHREIVEAACQAGKHVYVEAPLAHTVEDAQAIARAGDALTRSGKVFQVGLQYRGNPQHHHVLKFVRTGVLSTVAGGRGQWHRKTSWRKAAPTPEREAAMNWRLDRNRASGLLGEVGIHSLDVASWFMGKAPVATTGYGTVVQWNDGRNVPDTVHCVLEYPGGVRFAYEATLANSYDGAYELIYGTDAAVLIRDERAWMFKEADSPLLGWEVYARKETVGDETGICLVADATKQIKEGKIPGQTKHESDPGKTALFFAIEGFLNVSRGIGEKKTSDCGPLEGLQATVVAIKANEAALTGSRVVFQKEWFTL